MDNLVSATVSLLADTRMCTRCVQQHLDNDAGFQAVVSELQQSDLIIANLETPLSRRGYQMPKPASLRGDPEIIDDVRAIGIGAVTLANNHMMDFGPEALTDTLAACDRAGIARCGAGADLEAAMAPARLEANGVRIGLLSVATTVPMGAGALPGKPGIAPLRVGVSYEAVPGRLTEQPGSMPVVHSWVLAEDQEMVCRHIESLKKESDFVIVGIHWGVPDYWHSPYQGQLAQYQQPLGRAMVEAGADLIFGHHSHTLHPIEVYRGKPIFYSLGNFLFEFDVPRVFMERKSAIVRLEVAHKPRVELLPLVHDDQGVPRWAVGDEAAAVLEKLARLSEPFDAKLVFQGGRATIALD